MDKPDVFMRYSQTVLDKAFRDYEIQEKTAKSRGIEWQISFRQWLEWWGDDLFRRGSGKNRLQMQRFMDEGPYAIWNIKKGVPAENAVTAGNMRRKRASEAAKARKEALLDMAMWAPSAEPQPEMTDDEDELRKLGMRNSYVRRYIHIR